MRQIILALVIVSMGIVGCTKTIATAPLLMMATATMTQTATTNIAVNTATATATVTETETGTVIATPTATVTFDPVVNLHITTTNTISVVVKKSSEIVGTLVLSNNPNFLIEYTPGDVIEISAQDQNSLEIITVNATWDGGSCEATSEPDGAANYVELPALP